MTDTHLDAKLIMNMLSKMLGRINATMLASCTAKTKHQGGKATLDVSAHMSISQLIDRLQERQNFSVVFQEPDDRLIEPRQLLIGFVATGIMCRSTIEHVTTTITALVSRYAF